MTLMQFARNHERELDDALAAAVDRHERRGTRCLVALVAIFAAIVSMGLLFEDENQGACLVAMLLTLAGASAIARLTHHNHAEDRLKAALESGDVTRKAKAYTNVISEDEHSTVFDVEPLTRAITERLPYLTYRVEDSREVLDAGRPSFATRLSCATLDCPSDPVEVILRRHLVPGTLVTPDRAYIAYDYARDRIALNVSGACWLCAPSWADNGTT